MATIKHHFKQFLQARKDAQKLQYCCALLWRCKGTSSKKSKDGEPGKSKRYAITLNLPQTEFPLSMKNGAAAQREIEIQKAEDFQSLYKWQKEQNWAEEFILHDGPPYANGKTHVGHFVNKVLKDITNRYNVLKRRKVNYVPGWDCHGMPIEVKAIANAGGSTMSPLEIRAKARAFAKQTVEEQKASFKRWGIMADWNDIYTTFSPGYQIKQLQTFYNIYEKGYIYRDYMPVYWSPSSHTALAEAELEYNTDHISKSVYLAMPLVMPPQPLQSQIGPNLPIYAVIWTTTPWTLPFNRAICYNPKLKYAFLKSLSPECVYICEELFVEKLTALLSSPVELICTLEGSALEGCEYIHPMLKQRLPFLPGDHVLSGKGTGLVHTAPAHGHDDFRVAVKYQLPVECHVDVRGSYVSGVDDSLIGKTVGKDADEAVLSQLEPWILHTESITHSYPYDWRTKQPVIIRASQQWFVNTQALRQPALESLQHVKITPPKSENGMVTELNSRPYWCISRQRSWGVPIPIFYHRESNEPLITRETVDHLCAMIDQHGTDCWWELPESDLLPEHLVHKLNKGSSSDYVKGDDILDIWFDSGTSWAAVLSGSQADVYLEGLDQYKGWFQTSLLTSVAVNGRAPYRQIITHAFATDEEGKKMSKSLGNVVDPDQVIMGGKDKKASPSYGVDTLRWWVAHSHHHQQIMVGPNILSRYFEEIFKVRKCIRHLLGSLSDFNPLMHLIPYDEMTALDKYMMFVLYTTLQQMEQSYDSIMYNKIIQNLEKFVYSDLSSFYINITRDRCYCSDRNNRSRRSAQTAMYHIARTLTSAFAPVLPHLAEEIYTYLPSSGNSESDSVFRQGWQPADQKWNDPRIVNTFLPVFDIQRDMMNELDNEKPLEFDVIIYSSPKLHDLLRVLQPEVTSSTSSLCEVLQTSTVTVLDYPPKMIPDDAIIIKGSTKLFNTILEEGTVDVDYKLLLMSSVMNLCERCRRYTALTSNAPCSRCVEALAVDWAS